MGRPLRLARAMAQSGLYYTKQQLQGAGRYTGKCRVGNWNEDQEMADTLLKDFLAKKATGTLKLDK